MKNYLAIALALAGVCMASPAFAGAVGVNGGTSTDTKVIDNTYTHTNYVTKQAADVVDNTNYVTNSSTDYVTKNVTVDDVNTVYKNKTNTTNTYNNTYKVNGRTSSGSSSSLLSTSNSTVKNAINALADQERIAKTESGRYTYTDMKGAYYMGISNGKVYYYTKGCNGWGKYALMTSSSLSGITRTVGKTTSSSSTSTSTSRKKTGSDTSTSVSTALTSSSTARTAHTYTGTTSAVSTTFDGATESLTNVEYNKSSDLINIGDEDNFGGQYVAQGNIERVKHYDRDEYYTQTTTNTDHYNDTYTTTNKYTQTTTNTTTNHYTDTVTTTTNVTNTTNVTYSATLTGVTSPIVLDLDGDGKIEASNGKYTPHKGDFSKNVVMFDFNGNGFPMMMEWVGANDGLLCRPNADGTVNGRNLFGTANGYENGYDELSTLDVDHSGAVEGAELAGLQVWQDVNSNGVADKGELKSLDTLGITSISTNHNNYKSSFVRNGQTFSSYDWWPSVIDVREVPVAVNMK